MHSKDGNAARGLPDIAAADRMVETYYGMELLPDELLLLQSRIFQQRRAGRLTHLLLGQVPPPDDSLFLLGSHQCLCVPVFYVSLPWTLSQHGVHFSSFQNLGRRFYLGQ